jgi:hypothetical protein
MTAQRKDEVGTNFYHHEKPPCPTCGHADEPRHIGKSSGGWCFSLHVYPEDGIHKLEDWLARFATGEIRDEYGEAITPDAMRQQITERGRDNAWEDTRWHSGYLSEAHFHRSNHSQRGPSGLLRHQIDGHHCIGHGEGPWDHITGVFS